MSVVDRIETDEAGKPIFVGESPALKNRAAIRMLIYNA